MGLRDICNIDDYCKRALTLMSSRFVLWSWVSCFLRQSCPTSAHTTFTITIYASLLLKAGAISWGLIISILNRYLNHWSVIGTAVSWYCGRNTSYRCRHKSISLILYHKPGELWYNLPTDWLPMSCFNVKLPWLREAVYKVVYLPTFVDL